jgi:hypothetical protein
MGDPYKGRLAGHALIYGNKGVWHSYPCEAMCACRAHSEPLRTVKERIAWHQEHKADVLDEWVACGCDDRGREILL